jgi:hypothetical protein
MTPPYSTVREELVCCPYCWFTEFRHIYTQEERLLVQVRPATPTRPIQMVELDNEPIDELDLTILCAWCDEQMTMPYELMPVTDR